MVRKRDELGGFYHEPPYTPEEKAEFYRRSGDAKSLTLTKSDSITSFMHCRQCLEEKPDGVSPREWAQLEVGWTKLGIQVWCRRHECNVIHIDFEGHRHPAAF